MVINNTSESKTKNSDDEFEGDDNFIKTWTVQKIKISVKVKTGI